MGTLKVIRTGGINGLGSLVLHKSCIDEHLPPQREAGMWEQMGSG